MFSCSQLICPDFPQFDADRDEDEVFYDISVAVDSKLFPNKEAAAGKSLCALDNSMPWSPAKYFVVRLELNRPLRGFKAVTVLRALYFLV